jgi:hypothetical protein
MLLLVKTSILDVQTSTATLMSCSHLDFLLSSMLQLATLRVIKKPDCVIHNCTCVGGRVCPLKSCILKPHPQFFSCMFPPSI